jgi:hypothetical protein
MLTATAVATTMLCLFLGLPKASLLIFSLCLAALSPHNPKALAPLLLLVAGFGAAAYVKKKLK